MNVTRIPKVWSMRGPGDRAGMVVDEDTRRGQSGVPRRVPRSAVEWEAIVTDDRLLSRANVLDSNSVKGEWAGFICKEKEGVSVGITRDAVYGNFRGCEAVELGLHVVHLCKCNMMETKLLSSVRRLILVDFHELKDGRPLEGVNEALAVRMGCWRCNAGVAGRLISQYLVEGAAS